MPMRGTDRSHAAGCAELPGYSYLSVPISRSMQRAALSALVHSARVVTAAFVAPAIDEVHVGTGRDAQLDYTLIRHHARPGVALGEDLSRVQGQQVSPPGGDMGQFSERGGLPSPARRPARVPTAYVRDLGQHLFIVTR